MVVCIFRRACLNKHAVMWCYACLTKSNKVVNMVFLSEQLRFSLDGNLKIRIMASLYSKKRSGSRQAKLAQKFWYGIWNEYQLFFFLCGGFWTFYEITIIFTSVVNRIAHLLQPCLSRRKILSHGTAELFYEGTNRPKFEDWNWKTGFLFSSRPP